jgi:spermidine/putrescine transport system ATP-binding protein
VKGSLLSEHTSPYNTAQDVIRLEHVRKEFGGFVAVQDANFDIRRGEFFAMLGPSGCGKTTTLRMIAGFDLPTSGKVVLEDRDVTRVPPYKRNVNTVFQQYALFPHMNIRENVAFGLRSKGGITESEITRRVGEMLEIVRLETLATRRPNQLSGGQQQRVALARALVNLPSALLLDEPLAALDLKLRQAMQIELKRIQREVGITFVFVTHDQEEALTMSDRIAVMSQGNVEQIGSPKDIYNTPNSIFVAGFIGSANLLPGEIVERDGDSFLVQLRTGPRVRVAGEAGGPGDPVTVMVRPERLTPSREDPGTPNCVRGRITNVIFQGSGMRVVQLLDDHTELILHLEPNGEAAALQVGDVVYTSWGPDAAYLLRGWSPVIGATTTDVDEVQAQLDGASPTTATAIAAEVPKRRINRRALLIGGGVVAVGAVGALFISGSGSNGNSGGTGDASSGGLGTGDKTVRILNWPAYIDPNVDGAAGTVERFQDQTKIAVEYSENFNDNNEVFNKEFQAIIGNGEVMDYDIACPTNWMAARIKGLGWLDPLPYDLIPNYSNVDPQYLTLSWDRGGKYFMPWQAGITGIAWNRKLVTALVGREFTSVNDLFDPALKGKVAMLTEMRDSVGLTMLGLGKDPSALDEDGMNAALDKIQENVANGQIRQFTGNEYLQSLENENFLACTAWSGDVVQLTNPDVEFFIPKEGGMSWFDTMVIPKGAPNAVAAAKWMNFVYDPVNAAKITAYVQYVSPVMGVQAELRKLGGDAAALADNPILFPSDEIKARLHVFADLPDVLDAKITDRFLKITGA